MPALILAATTGLFLQACEDRSGTDARLRAHFNMPATAIVDEKSIRESILAIIPPGTPESVASTKLAGLGIGKDAMSRYYPPDATGRAIVRIEYDPAAWGFVRRHYGILLNFDGGMKLVDVKVLPWLTGS